MGQRSQIYIRYNVEGKKGLIARYYSWNYGERMISRARGIIEAIQNEYLKYSYMWESSERLNKLTRICDVNFDMRDIVISADIIKEVQKDYTDEIYKEKDFSYIFQQDNNDGQLLIDVVDEEIKYCFIPYSTEIKPMDGSQYMQWNACNGNKKKDWRNPTQYRDIETICYTMENIDFINKNATLMTKDEAFDFISADYSYLFPSEEFEKELTPEDKIKESAKEIVEYLKNCNFGDITDSSGLLEISDTCSVDIYKSRHGDSGEHYVIYCRYEKDEAFDYRYTTDLTSESLEKELLSIYNDDLKNNN